MKMNVTLSFKRNTVFLKKEKFHPIFSVTIFISFFKNKFTSFHDDFSKYVLLFFSMTYQINTFFRLKNGGLRKKKSPSKQFEKILH